MNKVREGRSKASANVALGSQSATPVVEAAPSGLVHCYMCTHRVPAKLAGDARVRNASARKTQSGQICPRCNASLDSAYVLEVFPLPEPAMAIQ